jgi:hypothetical protein
MSKKKHCFYTSFNKAYAGQAMMLAESLRKYHGDDSEICALLIDDLSESEIDYFKNFDRIILAKNLNIPNFQSWIFGLDIVEAATAVKPFLMCNLLEEFSQVTYLDPDVFVYSHLHEIFDPKVDWDVTLTPHQVAHQSEPWVVLSTEMESLRFGVFNLGFLSIRATANGKSIARWWQDRCYDYCIAEPERGLFTDQKIFDLAPALFSGIHILRHPGFNVATWNIRGRHVEFGNLQISVNGFPLRFCHFTKATHIGGYALERMISENNIFDELFYSYVAKLQAKNIMLRDLSKRWIYGFYNNGNPIDPKTRKNFRNRQNRFLIENPFLDEKIL